MPHVLANLSLHPASVLENQACHTLLPAFAIVFKLKVGLKNIAFAQISTNNRSKMYWVSFPFLMQNVWSNFRGLYICNTRIYCP